MHEDFTVGESIGNVEPVSGNYLACNRNMVHILVFIGLIGVVISVVGIIAFIRRQIRLKDIVLNGLPAIGRVVAIKSSYMENTTLWTLAIEFTVPGHSEPTRFESYTSISGLFSAANKSLKALREGDSVRIHYRKESPADAAVDALSRRVFQSSKPLEW